MALKDHVPGSLKCNVPFFLWDCVNYGVVAQLGKYLDTNYTGNKKLNVFIKCDDVEFKGYLLIIGKVSSSHLKWSEYGLEDSKYLELFAVKDHTYEYTAKLPGFWNE